MSRDLLPPDLLDALHGEPEADALAAVWTQAAVLAEGARPAVDTDAAWAAVRAQTLARASEPRSTRPPVAPPRAARFGRTRRFAMAALAAAALGVVALGVWWSQPVAVVAGVGETVAVVLPDGSAVDLNSGSRLVYDRRFGALWGTPAERAVRLEGEAFFDVEPGAVPFVVATFNARVEVLGTAFNVDARAAERTTAVALVHGQVRLVGEDDAAEDALQALEAVVLAPGETAQVVTMTSGLTVAPPVETNAARRTAWRTGGLAFDAEPMPAVLAEIERRYGIAFVLDARVSTETAATAFYATRPSLDTLLGDLGVTWGVRFVPGPGGYRVVPAP
ncbi:MAG: FecR domain-containing protein [Bacteroidota bacterium]